mmetsp:Transcript_4290/g.13160  ORF Transcript_4290/g.13160 Transcript_4290/m.13160 type:complete len:280 (-) Transcript_4290:658-1497(-)
MLLRLVDPLDAHQLESVPALLHVVPQQRHRAGVKARLGSASQQAVRHHHTACTHAAADACRRRRLHCLPARVARPARAAAVPIWRLCALVALLSAALRRGDPVGAQPDPGARRAAAARLRPFTRRGRLAAVAASASVASAAAASVPRVRVRLVRRREGALLVPLPPLLGPRHLPPALLSRGHVVPACRLGSDAVGAVAAGQVAAPPHDLRQRGPPLRALLRRGSLQRTPLAALVRPRPRLPRRDPVAARAGLRVVLVRLAARVCLPALLPPLRRLAPRL